MAEGKVALSTGITGQDIRHQPFVVEVRTVGPDGVQADSCSARPRCLR